MNNAASSAKKPWTTGEKALLGALLAIVVLVATGIFWEKYVNAIPAVTIPTPTLPSPNAYDNFVAAGNAVADGDKIGAAIAPPDSPHTNTGPDHAYTLGEKTALVQENAGALQTLRQGFAFPYQSPPIQSFNTVLPYYAKFRGLARLLTLQGQVAESQSDWGGAAKSRLDAVELGVKIPRGGPLIGNLVGIACQAIGRRPLWADAEHLNAAQAKNAARRLERLSAQQVSYADTLREEKWGTQASLMELFHRPDWAGDFVRLGQPEGRDDTGSLAERLRIGITPKRTVMGHYTNYMDRIIANAGLPYAAKSSAPSIPNDPANTVLCPVFTGADLKYTDNQVENALLTVTLALHAYQLDHRAYPVNLQALMPGYLSRIPDDPFALSGPLRYKPQGATYLLYSVGPDGKDDGGRAIFNASKPAPGVGASTDQRRSVQANSQGDIVAGINLF